MDSESLDRSTMTYSRDSGNKIAPLVFASSDRVTPMQLLKRARLLANRCHKFKTRSKMVWVSRSGVTDLTTTASSRMELNKDTEFITGLTVQSTQALGRLMR